MSNHSILHPRIRHYAYAVLRQWRVRACCSLHPDVCCIASRRISAPGISSSGCLPGHDPTDPDPRISDPWISHTPHLHELRSWWSVCVYQHAWAQRTRTPYSTYRASGVTPDPMPHTFGPRCRSRGLSSGVIPGSMDPGILFRYHRVALVWGLRPLGLLLRPNLWTSGPTV